MKNGIILSFFVVSVLLLFGSGNCPAGVSADLVQAQESAAKADYDAAIAAYEAIVAAYPQSDEAMKSQAGLSIVYINVGRFEKADDAVDSLVSDFADKAGLGEELARIAERFEWQRQYQRAGAIYEKTGQVCPQSAWGRKAPLYARRCEILALVQEGKSDAADVETERLMSDFAGHADLPEVMYNIAWNYAVRFAAAGRGGEGERLYNEIISRWPQSPYAEKARIDIAHRHVRGLIEAGEFAEAEAAVERMKADFARSADLGEALYWIAERFEVGEQFATAGRMYRQCAEDHPGAWFAEDKHAPLAAARTQMLGLAETGQGDIQAAVDGFISRFGQNESAQQVLDDVARRCRYSGKRNEAVGIYRLIVQKWPGTQYALKARGNIAIVNIENGENGDILPVVDSLAADFPGDIGLADVLCEIAETWGRSRFQLDSFGCSKGIYEKVVELFPQSSQADKARMNIGGAELMQLAAQQDDTVVLPKIDELIGRFNGQPGLGDIINRVGHRCYEKGFAKEDGSIVDANELRTALNIWGRIIDGPADVDVGQRAYAYFLTAGGLWRLGEYDKSREYFQKVLDEWPQYMFHHEAFAIMADFGCEQERKAQLTKALEKWQKDIADNPQSEKAACAMFYSGCCLQELGEQDKAREYYRQVVEGSPACVFARQAKFMLEHPGAKRIQLN